MRGAWGAAQVPRRPVTPSRVHVNRRNSSQPQRPALGALTAAVLAVHLALLRAGTQTPPSWETHAIARMQVRWTAAEASEHATKAAAESTTEPATPSTQRRAHIDHSGAADTRTRKGTSTTPGPRQVRETAIDARPEASRHALDPASAAAPSHKAVVPRIPPPRVLVYTLAGSSRGQPVEGSAHLRWSHDDERYEAWLVQSSAGGERVQHSAGTLNAAGLVPGRFGDRAAGSRSEQAAHFERDPSGTGGRIRFSGNQPDAALTPGSQDRLSVLVQLAGLAAAAHRPLRPGQTVRVPVASARDARPWTFEVEAEEDLPPASTPTQAAAHPATPLRALRLRRRPDGEYDIELLVWLAPALDYLPVRLRLTQAQGDWLEQRWDPADAR